MFLHNLFAASFFFLTAKHHLKRIRIVQPPSLIQMYWFPAQVISASCLRITYKVIIIIKHYSSIKITTTKTSVDMKTESTPVENTLSKMFLGDDKCSWRPLRKIHKIVLLAHIYTISHMTCGILFCSITQWKHSRLLSGVASLPNYVR